MKEKEIHKIWSEFINNEKYFKKIVKKSTKIKEKENKENKENKVKRELSEYQELSKRMSIQNSKTTKLMFEDKKLWHKYHDARDISFMGYDNQDEIPLNKIIEYLETKKNRKLKILDLGCGRNEIKRKFKENKKFEIEGYDYISYNGSIESDISNLKDENESVDICVFSQSLMGSNWKEYINEAIRVLRYNGEIIISESIERYEKIKEYINEKNLHIKRVENKKGNRWFYMYILND